MNAMIKNTNQQKSLAESAAEIPLLDIDRLTVRFGGLTAVSELDLEVKKGSIVSLIGPNGAGKTTAFNTISGIYEPSVGTVRFQGRRLEREMTASTVWGIVIIGLIIGSGLRLSREGLRPDSLLSSRTFSRDSEATFVPSWRSINFQGSGEW